MNILGFLIGLVLLTSFFLIGCSSFGTKPSEKDMERFSSSKQFNKNTKVFQNRNPVSILNSEEKIDYWKLLKMMFNNDNDNLPEEKLAEIKPDLNKFLKNDGELKSIWLGHSTFLLNMNGNIILIDPVFSNYAAPVNLMIKRFQDPILKLEELPEIDYIVISHDHYDHLDMKSIKYFRNLKSKFIAPLGVGAHLEGWGISRSRISEKDWWEVEDFAGIKFIATPAQHFSGRGISDKNHTLWASWVIQTKNHNVYFSGDSGYDTHFKDIGDRYGPFDVAFMESGQYNEMWKPVHLTPDKFVQAFKEVKAKKYFPIHWGMFKLSTHSWYEPIIKLYELSKKENFQLLAPKIGQVLNIKNPEPIETWWIENAI